MKKKYRYDYRKRLRHQEAFARGAGLVADTCEERRDERVVALQQASFEESRDQAAWVGVPYMFNTLRDTE
ncbi:hypothetical protein QR685DRAFT_572931 [Neurospora intermedia]|uniref:Uncharacterized protein n=1 Tax=Neurospora intermedia TaxID=5142 RepID=A0ABR3DCN4_NEUIN